MTTVGDWRLQAIMRRLAKLKGRSIDELRERAAQAISAELELRRFANTIGEPSDKTLHEQLDVDSIAGQTDLDDGLREHFTTRQAPQFFAGVRDGSSAAELRGQRWSNELGQLVAAADAVVDGRFDLLGHDGLEFGSPIDWHFDPVSNKRAPRIHWSRIPYLDADLIGDHKVIWEINRHQHFFILGRAFQATRRPEYAQCFATNLASWMDANPPKDGVNWASSLEVSYRAIAWLWALELFRESPVLTAAVVKRMLKYLYIHGRHLERYLSTYFSPNTHLTGEALGLLYLGLLLPEFRRARQWCRTGWQILERELPRQVHADGVYFEQATYYHRYTVDIYLHALLLAERNSMPLPAVMRERLALAAGHLADLTRADGSMPIVGDDDGGRLVVLEARPFADVRSTLATASVVLGKPELAAVAGAATEEVLWLLGPAGVRDVDGNVGAAPPAHTSTLFATGGYAVMRDGWDANAKHAVIDCGPLGAMNCGHAHSDALSIEVSAGGCPFLVDPGTYTYTESAADRDHFRHSAAHNTVTVDGESASVSDGPFSWASRADAKVASWWTGGVVDRLVASHGGFERLSDPATHRRSVYFVRGEYWLVVDTILTAGEHESTAHFHAALGSRVTSVTASTAWIDAPCAAGWSRLFFAAAGDVDALEWGEDWVSPSYGSRARAPYARVTSRGRGRRDLVTVLCPLPEGEGISVEELPTEGGKGRAVVVNRPDRHDVFLFGTEGSVRVSGVEMYADAALVRRRAPDGDVTAVALFGADARLRVVGLSFHATDAAEAVRVGDRWEVSGVGEVAGSR
ncbi:MAG: alginate lyase family protein [Gemmatimonadaceae bacterium]